MVCLLPIRCELIFIFECTFLILYLESFFVIILSLQKYLYITFHSIESFYICSVLYSNIFFFYIIYSLKFFLSPSLLNNFLIDISVLKMSTGLFLFSFTFQALLLHSLLFDWLHYVLLSYRFFSFILVHFPPRTI